MSVSPFNAVASRFNLNASSVIRHGCNCQLLLLLLDGAVLIPSTAFIGRPCFMTSYHAPAIGRSLIDTPITFSPFITHFQGTLCFGYACGMYHSPDEKQKYSEARGDDFVEMKPAVCLLSITVCCSTLSSNCYVLFLQSRLSD